MWNERFAGDEFFYGTKPNDFLAENVQLLSGEVLSLCEGEGRNAVFMAKQGLVVHAVDGSSVGLEKAQKLAAAQGVNITTEVADLTQYSIEPASYGAAVSIFAHLPSAERKKLHAKVEQGLKPQAVFLLEGYSKNQLANDTGGPKNLDMLFSVEELLGDFSQCDVILAHEIEREVIEGQGHTGLASVVQLLLRKR